MIAALVQIALCTALPAPTGPWTVGTASLDLVDGKRRDPVHRELKREMMVQLWYPARRTKQRASYFLDPRMPRVLEDNQYFGQNKELLAAWGTLQSGAFLGARVSGRRRWPILLFSPGLGVAIANYSAFCQEMASHGFFIVAIDSPYAGVSVSPDGRVRTSGDDPDLADMKAYEKKIREWAADASFVLDVLHRSKFNWALDFGRVAICGHSMGGSAAMAAARMDPRFKAAVDFDGALSRPVVEIGCKTAILVLRSDPNYSDEDLKRLGRTRQQWDMMVKQAEAWRLNRFLGRLDYPFWRFRSLTLGT